MLQLLQETVQQCIEACTEQLCQLPAARQLSPGAFQQLLQQASEKDSLGCMQQLCWRPAVGLFSPDDMQHLLQQSSAECREQLLDSFPIKAAFCSQL